MWRENKHPVALIGGGLVALGLTLGAVRSSGAKAGAHAFQPSAPTQFPLPDPTPSPPPFDAGPPPSIDAAPYDAGYVYDAGR
jgi:hypothetical protein